MVNKIFSDLSGYEKGVVARALLATIIKRGHVDGEPSHANEPSEIVVSLEPWHMKLLACFSEEGRTDQLNLDQIREVLSQTR